MGGACFEKYEECPECGAASKAEGFDYDWQTCDRCWRAGLHERPLVLAVRGTLRLAA